MSCYGWKYGLFRVPYWASSLPVALQNYSAKLSDFGLARDGPTGDKSHVSTRVMGTHGYAAPEDYTLNYYSISTEEK